MKWERDESDKHRVRKLEIAIENCLMLAGRKRTTRYTYQNETSEPIPHGPRSEDEDWDHIKRFCKSVGCDFSVIRSFGGGPSNGFDAESKLYDFAVSSNHEPESLLAYIRDYPEIAAELVDLYVELKISERFPPDPNAVVVDPDASAAWEQFKASGKKLPVADRPHAYDDGTVGTEA